MMSISLLSLSHSTFPTKDDEWVNALNSGFKDFEDSLQNYAAVKFGAIDVILTRNIKDFRKSEIGVLTPETYIKSIIARR